MSTLTITSKGQVTLKKEVLKHLGVLPGDKVEIETLPGGLIQVKAAQRTGDISDIFGRFKWKGERGFTIDEINEAIAKGWAGER